jgi:hypothetical protein
MAAQEESEVTEKRQVLDTPVLKKFIAKVKKGDASLQEQIDAVEANELKIAVGPDGSNEMTFYRGELL